jgi:hypothetical protein
VASPEKVVAVVGMLCESYNRRASETLFAAYDLVLRDVEDEQLAEGGTAALSGTTAFMPTPGQLRQTCLTGGKSFATQADIAWHEFDRAVSMQGGDRSVTFADGLINATVRLLGGWIHCCERTGDDYFVWLQKQFKETYLRLCESGANDELRRPLTGRLELENSGYPSWILGKLNAYTGHEMVAIGTSQRVLAGPTQSPARIADRSGAVPQIEFKKVERAK